MNMKLRLIVMNFLQFAVWGAYLTSMGSYLAKIGMGAQIGWFYSIQGVVSLFMPALMGVVADKYIPAQKLLGFCHAIAALFMGLAGFYGMSNGNEAEFSTLFLLYTISVAFYMPTLGLSNSVAYTSLEKARLDIIKTFPPIRTFGTIGFICSMWTVDLLGFQADYRQFFMCAFLSVLMAIYAFTLPQCPVNNSTGNSKQSWAEVFGLRAFALFKQKKMAYFFIFSMLLGVSLQITNGYANPFISSFGAIDAYKDTFGVQHANLLISLSQISETCCILLIPFFLGKYGIKKVMLIAMVAWVLRFALFGLGDPGSKVWMFLLSMLVYGVAFDFFNVSGSLFVDKETDVSMRSSAQGLFILMTNGFGASIGTLGAQYVVNHFVDFNSTTPQIEGWSKAWFVFAAYAAVVAVAFALLFKYKHNNEKTSEV